MARDEGQHSTSLLATKYSKTVIIKTEQAGVSVHNQNTVNGIHVVATPMGPTCNLNCKYCICLEKQALFGAGEKYRMSDKLLSRFITN